jgi:hypothetical protein
MALRAADRHAGLCRALDAVWENPRDPDLIPHRQIDLLRQRIDGLALGYDDLNDRDTLRGDVVWQSAVERGEELASSATLCRLDSRADRRTAVAMSRGLGEQFLASFREAPAELILDFGATDDRVHGRQEGRFIHGYCGYSAEGANPRLIVTSLEGDAQRIYNAIYRARGAMENRIKQQPLGVFADRTSCQAWWANQYRLLLSSAACVLMETIRRVGLRGTELARAEPSSFSWTAKVGQQP